MSFGFRAGLLLSTLRRCFELLDCGSPTAGRAPGTSPLTQTSLAASISKIKRFLPPPRNPQAAPADALLRNYKIPSPIGENPRMTQGFVRRSGQIPRVIARSILLAPHGRGDVNPTASPHCSKSCSKHGRPPLEIPHFGLNSNHFQRTGIPASLIHKNPR